MKNPYTRIKEIDAELETLEIREKAFKNKSWKRKPRELEDIENSIFFLLIEKKPIEETIKWFENRNARDVKEGEGVKNEN